MLRCSSQSTLALVILLALGAGSCHKPIRAVVGTPVALPVHRAATFARTDLELFFRRVASDSRCPTGAQCVWAGEATVTVDARLAKGPVESFDLKLSAREDSTVWKPFDGYRIRVVSLDPYPRLGVTTDSSGYVATLLVEKR
jgi:hypothetical protein